MGWLDYALAAIIAFCIFCPPKYDPAIRWKERNESKRKK